jgi:hypothetical protein
MTAKGNRKAEIMPTCLRHPAQLPSNVDWTAVLQTEVNWILLLRRNGLIPLNYYHTPKYKYCKRQLWQLIPTANSNNRLW